MTVVKVENPYNQEVIAELTLSTWMSLMPCYSKLPIRLLTNHKGLLPMNGLPSLTAAQVDAGPKG